MRIAAITDIHGNLDALDVVLADISRRGADVIVNLGDVLSGPLKPCETADRLMPLKLPTIRGNHERQLMAPDVARMGLSDRHAAQTITSAQRDWIAALPATCWLSDDVFLCHGSPESDLVYFLEEVRDGECHPAPPELVERRAAECDASLILCGHTHIPRLAQLRNGQTIVNPGSVGLQAYTDSRPVPHKIEIGSPHARYAIVEQTAQGWVTEFIALPYDWEKAAKLAEAHSRPEWARALRAGFV
jgi:putative phosphoesterase